MAATPAHWSAVDRGPRTDAERHAEIVRLNDELDVARAWRSKMLAAIDADIEVLEAAIRQRLAQPANQPTRRSR
jgi:hypothetical protein